MYYSAGNYEAFAHAEKPEGADKKSAYIIGSGLAGLSAAFYLVRDAQLREFTTRQMFSGPRPARAIEAKHIASSSATRRRRR